MRKALLGALLFFAPALHAQVTAPTIILVGSAPSGSCSNNLPDRQVASTGVLYSCQSGTWAQIGGSAGATLPFPGLVYATSASGGTVATAAQVSALVTGAINPSSTGATTLGKLSSDLFLDAANFSGADPSVKINACGTALLAVGGGTCDARSLGGTSLQSMSETIAWGSHALISTNESMVLLLPNTAQWEWALTGGTACGIEQFSNTSIIGDNTGGMWAGMQLVAASTANMDSLYCTDPSPVSGFGSNIYATGFFATNANGGTFANGLVDFRELADDANFYRITAINPSGDAMHIKDVCCGDSWDSVQGLSATSTAATGTGHAVVITGKYTNIVIRNSTFNGPGTSKYNVYIDPTSNSNGLTFLGLYGEKYSTGDYGTPMVYVGADAENTNIFGGLLTNGCTSSCAQYAVQNASLQGLNIEGLGYGYFSTNGVNDTANSFTQPTDGFEINNYHTRYTTGSAGPVNIYQDMSVGKLSGNLMSGAPSFSATTGTATLNSGSTNTFGSIASTTSGTLAFNLTMTGGPQLHRLVCTYTDETTPTDILHETGSTSQYQSFASGTTVSGDTIVYVCGGY